MGFDLEKAIAAWRRTLEHNRAYLREDIDELECHVRDGVEALLAGGSLEEDAFRQALERMGDLGSMEAEYRKTFWPRIRHRHHVTDTLKAEADMLANYLKIAGRNLLRHKGYSFINVAGLAVGVACCLLILLFVQHERSFDSFHTQGDRLYRLNKIVTPQEGGEERHAISSGRMGPTMVEDFPEVEQTVRLLPWFDDVLTIRGDAALLVPETVVADANFFEVFDFTLLRGDPKRVLEAPLAMVLTETTARRFFGDEGAVGQSLIGLNGETYTITGIAADPPANSHLTFNALVSWSSTVPGVGALNMLWLNNWLTQVAYTYVLLAPGADAAALEAKLPAFMLQHFAERADQYRLYLQPLSDIYLRSANLLYTDHLRLGNANYVNVFSIVAALILLIAAINFMNLSTARAARRAREVGMRKVLGAYRNQLVRQFMGESMLLVGLAVLIGLGIVVGAAPLVTQLTGTSLSVGWTWLPGGLAVILLLVGAVSGLYPAVILSAYQPVHVLKSGWRGRARGAGLRKVLVTAQFAISTTLIAGTLLVYQQMQYLSARDLGFDREHVVVLPTGDTSIRGRLDAFKQTLLQHPNITHATASGGGPGFGTMGFTLFPEGKPDTETWSAQIIRLNDFDFLDTYGLEMAEGRFFATGHATDSAGVVINETLARSLGWADPVGKRLDVRGELTGGTVIGVVKDFHYRSLREPITPLILMPASRHGILSVRLTGSDVPGTLAFIQQLWERFEPQYPFEYHFVDDAFAAFYQAEARMMGVLGFFAALAIGIACLGLFGLAAFTAEQRTKEIGVRKVMGATARGIVALLSKDFLKLVLAGFILATPIAYLAMSRWLDGFAYHIEISWTSFIVVGAGTGVAALAAVGFQALKAALADPATTLRHE